MILKDSGKIGNCNCPVEKRVQKIKKRQCRIGIISYICLLFRISLNKNSVRAMSQASHYYVFDYNMIDFNSCSKKSKCCKRYKKKGKINCSDCPKLNF